VEENGAMNYRNKIIEREKDGLINKLMNDNNDNNNNNNNNKLIIMI
jgi:hypothetical protein